ncbi:MAG: 2-isopropylmalate synthase [Anaerolineales bacterium]|nr:2-isopropylmalate synthase [Anaerolineales bacterium]
MVRLQAGDAGIEDRSFGGYGADTDIIVASAKAYVNALNKLVAAQRAQAVANGAGETPVAAATAGD